ncbi:MAG: 2-phosphosulfolactate phosphatase, partial [Sarcina sp.]
MKIDLIISAEYIKQADLKEKVVVVIDMLRATSVITTALFNGAKKVIPTLTVEEAFEKAENLKCKGEEFVLGGERQALKIDGFNFSNSPLEYTTESVQGKTVIITTTNGTRALNLCTEANKILIGAMINGKKVAQKLKELNKDIIFINAGTNGEFS